MPTLTRFFLRAAMVNLVASVVLGLAISVPGLEGLMPWRPVYIHLLVLGWATQMIFGVAYWMFPRIEPLDLTRQPWLGWVCFAALNLGLLLRAVGEPALGHGRDQAARVVVAAALLQLLSVLAFVVLAWRRVRAR